MNNQTKILLNIQGIEGRTLRPLGKKKVKWQITKGDIYPELLKKKNYKEASKVVRKGTVSVPQYEQVQCQQSIKLTYDAFIYMTSVEQPYWFKGPWKLMTRKQRLEVHLQRICEDRKGTSYTYSILED